MYAIFLNGKYVRAYLDLNQPHEPFDLPHIQVEELPEELINTPQGYICTYENGVFGLEKLPEVEPNFEELQIMQNVDFDFRLSLLEMGLVR